MATVRNHCPLHLGMGRCGWQFPDTLLRGRDSSDPFARYESYTSVVSDDIAPVACRSPAIQNCIIRAYRLGLGLTAMRRRNQQLLIERDRRCLDV